MKRTIIFLILTWLGVSFGLNAQAETAVSGSYPTFYKESVLLDNLLVYQNKDRVPRKLVSDIFDSLYYTRPVIRNSNSWLITDSTNTRRAFHVRTAKAQDGYLYVNRCITDKVLSSGCQQDTVKITYVYNNKEVTTKEDVKRVVRLRKRKIRISDFIFDERKGLVTVYIVDK